MIVQFIVPLLLFKKLWSKFFIGVVYYCFLRLLKQANIPTAQGVLPPVAALPASIPAGPVESSVPGVSVESSTQSTDQNPVPAAPAQLVKSKVIEASSDSSQSSSASSSVSMSSSVTSALSQSDQPSISASLKIPSTTDVPEPIDEEVWYQSALNEPLTSVRDSIFLGVFISSASLILRLPILYQLPHLVAHLLRCLMFKRILKKRNLICKQSLRFPYLLVFYRTFESGGGRPVPPVHTTHGSLEPFH